MKKTRGVSYTEIYHYAALFSDDYRSMPEWIEHQEFKNPQTNGGSL